MAEIVDPFDTPQASRPAPQAAQPSGIVDPFDNPQPRETISAVSTVGDKLLTEAPGESAKIGAATLAKAGTTSDFGEQVTILAKDLFPDMPLAKAKSRFAQKGDDIIYVDRLNKVQKITPDLLRSPFTTNPDGTIGLQMPIKTDNFGKRVMDNAAYGVSRLPEEAASGAVDLALQSRSVPLPVRAPIAGGVQALASVPRQMVGNYLSGKDLLDLDTGELAQAGAAGASASGINAASTRFFQRNRPGLAYEDTRKLQTREGQREVAGAVENFREQGITPTLGQVADVPSARVKERQLFRREVGRNELEALYKDQAKQIGDRWRALTAKLGNPNSVQAVAELRDTAQTLIDDAVAARTQAASPMYEEAFQSGAEPDITDVIDFAEDQLSQVRGPRTVERVEFDPTDFSIVRAKEDMRSTGTKAAQEINNAIKLLTNERVTVDPKTGLEDRAFLPITDYRQLHSAKEEIDARIEDIQAVGTSAEKRALRSLTMIQQKLTEALKAAHPKYAEGNELFKSLSGPIDEMRNGQIGAIASIRESKSNLRPDMLSFVLDAGAVGEPDVIRKTREQILAAPNGKEVWDNAVAAYFRRALQKSEVGEARNFGNVSIAGSLRKALFKTPDQREALKAAVGEENFASFNKFFDVLRRIEDTLPENSATATDIDKSFAGPAAKAAAWVLQLRNVLNPGELVVNISDSINAERLATVFTTPKGLKELEKLKALDPKGKTALQVVSRIITMAAADAFDQGPDQVEVYQEEAPTNEERAQQR